MDATQTFARDGFDCAAGKLQDMSTPPSPEDEFQIFFELSGTGNVMADAATFRFIRVNSAFCQMTGYSDDELGALTFFDITHPDDIEADRRAWEDCLKSDASPPAFEKRYMRKDGSVLWANVTIASSRGAGGAPVRALAVVRDITGMHDKLERLERARARYDECAAQRTSALAHANEALDNVIAERQSATEQLVDASRSLHTLIETCPIAIIALDAAQFITVWNPAAEDLFGWPEAEVLGHPLPNLPVARAARRELESLLATRQLTQHDARLRTRDGDFLDLGLLCAPFPQVRDGSGGHLLLLMDMTEKKFLERSLLDASEREQRRIGQELHDHLCQHLLGAAFATKALSAALEKEGSACTSRLDDVARLINDSVQQTRDIARGLNPVEIDAGGLMSALQELAARVNSTIPCKLECKSPVFVANSEVALHAYRIAQEAVTNAIKHASPATILVRLSAGRTCILLEIIDDGAGLDQTCRMNCKRMGLAIMKYRTQAMRGELAIDSASGLGTTISVRFPKAT